MPKKSLEDIIAELAEEHKKTEAAQQKTEAALASLAVKQEKTEAALASLAVKQEKTEAAQQKTEAAQQKTEAAQQKTEAALASLVAENKETGRYIKEIGKQVGGLSNKFGSFAEDLSVPSLEKILKTQFGMNEIYHRLKSTRNGGNMELDMLAVRDSGSDRAMVVEIKSKVTQESVDQLKGYLETVNSYFPFLRDKIKTGMLAGVGFSNDLLDHTQRQGFYCAVISDDQYFLKSIEGFQPKEYR